LGQQVLLHQVLQEVQLRQLLHQHQLHQALLSNREHPVILEDLAVRAHRLLHQLLEFQHLERQHHLVVQQVLEYHRFLELPRVRPGTALDTHQEVLAPPASYSSFSSWPLHQHY